jgi:hypothetical protein
MRMPLTSLLIEGTPIEMGISAIGVSQKKIYVDFSRMGGSGWGRVMRLNLPPAQTNIYPWRSYNTAKGTAKTLGSVEDMGCTSGGFVYLCGSPDGHLVYYGDCANYYEYRRKNYWIINDGQVESVIPAQDRKAKTSRKPAP